MADQAGEGLLSPFLHRRRVAVTRPYLRGRVLDVGCGTGGLSRFVAKGAYVGLEIDPVSRAEAARHHPGHRFCAQLAPDEGGFDTIVLLAVIEHVPAPLAFIREFAARLETGPEARIVITTPHPLYSSVHELGARMGIFSHSASEEHQQLLGFRALAELAGTVGFAIAKYRRFLLGANQLIVLRRNASCQ